MKTKNSKLGKNITKKASGYVTIMKGIQQTPSGKYRARFSMNGELIQSPIQTSVRKAQMWRNNYIKNN